MVGRALSFGRFLVHFCQSHPLALFNIWWHSSPPLSPFAPNTPIQKRKKTNKVKSQNLIKPRQHSYSIVKVLNSASEMRILQYVTDLWTINITFYKEKLNPPSSLMTGATYWCKKQTAIVLVSDTQRNAASQKLIWLMILARYFIHVWIGVQSGLAGTPTGANKL